MTKTGLKHSDSVIARLSSESILSETTSLSSRDHPSVCDTVTM